MINKVVPSRQLHIETAEEIKGWIDGSSISKSTLETPQKDHHLTKNLRHYNLQAKVSQSKLKTLTAKAAVEKSAMNTGSEKHVKETILQKPNILIEQEEKYVLDSLSEIQQPDAAEDLPVISPEFKPYNEFQKQCSKSHNPTPQRRRGEQEGVFKAVIGTYGVQEEHVYELVRQRKVRILKVNDNKPRTAETNRNRNQLKATSASQTDANNANIKYSNVELATLQERMKEKEAEILDNFYP